jgi:hypothetical protein
VPQIDVIIKLLFDPRLDTFTKDLTDKEEGFREEVEEVTNGVKKRKSDPNLDKSPIWKSFIKEMFSLKDIETDRYLDLYDYNAISDALDEDYEEALVFQNQEKKVLIGFERENFVAWWDSWISWFVDYFCQYYPTMVEKDMRWTIANYLKYGRKTIYDLLLPEMDNEYYKFSKIYIIGSGPFRELDFRYPPIPYPSRDEAYATILKLLDNNKTKVQNKDYYFNWFCWSESQKGKTRKQILNKWNENQLGALYYDETQVTKHKKIYKETYTDYFR